MKRFKKKHFFLIYLIYRRNNKMGREGKKAKKSSRVQPYSCRFIGAEQDNCMPTSWNT